MLFKDNDHNSKKNERKEKKRKYLEVLSVTNALLAILWFVAYFEDWRKCRFNLNASENKGASLLL